jgi:microcystin-dependent protein
MADPFVAEIRIFPFNFAPRGWAFCDGQLLPLSQNTALFSLLGTTYGGDGRTTFALPNLQGRAAIAHGQGPGLTLRDLGEQGGSDTVTLLTSEIPTHTHTLTTSTGDATQSTPAGALLATGIAVGMYASTSPTVTLAPSTLAIAGSSQPHQNAMPSLVFNFCIALQGVFPPRS